MSIKLYMDVHVRQAVTEGLRLRNVDVLTAQEDGTAELDDAQLLDRATEADRVLFTQDDDLLREAKRRQQSGVAFAGVIYAHQIKVSVGGCIDDLDLIALATEPANCAIAPSTCRSNRATCKQPLLEAALFDSFNPGALL